MNKSRSGVLRATLVIAACVPAIALAAPAASSSPTFKRVPDGTFASPTQSVVSANGRYVAFVGIPNPYKYNSWFAYRYDRSRNLVTQVDIGMPAGCVGSVAISGDGRYMLFTRSPCVGGAAALYERDLTAGRTYRISTCVPSPASYLNTESISADATTIAYNDCSNSGALATTEKACSCTPLVVQKQSLTRRGLRFRLLLTINQGFASSNMPGNYSLSLSRSGRYVAYPLVNGSTVSVAVRDLSSTKVALITPTASAQYFFPQLDGAGSQLAYVSTENGISQYLVQDLHSGSTVDVSSLQTIPLVATKAPALSISDDGRYIVFTTTAAPADPTAPPAREAIYRADLRARAVTRMTAAAAGSCPPLAEDACVAGESTRPSLSSDGSVLSFLTDIPMASGDANGGSTGVYLRVGT